MRSRSTAIARPGIPGAQSAPIRVGRRLWLHRDGDPIMGIGILELLVRVERSGSLHRAALEMGMAYSKAWPAVRRAEEVLGITILERRTGGAGGGGSTLSPEGKRLVVAFGAMVEEADRMLDDLGARYLDTWPSTAGASPVSAPEAAAAAAEE
jgi:molybdate transport system regulatory protein